MLPDQITSSMSLAHIGFSRSFEEQCSRVDKYNHCFTIVQAHSLYNAIIE